MLQLNNPVIQKLLKFGLVGLSGLCIDFFVTWTIKEKLHFNKYIANTIGFSLAVINNFLLNYFWTFYDTKSSVGASIGLFVAFAAIGLALNNFLIYIFTEFITINFYLAKCIAIAAVFFWNFFANYIFTFHA